MNKYEILYIISSDTADADRQTILEKMSKIVTDNGGSDVKVEEWGMKKFAYPINFKNEGYYVLMNFSGNGIIPPSIEKYVSITEAIVRIMITKKD